jgi:hypothetical protein
MSVDDELHHHIEERVDRLVASGMAPDEARRVALEHFGDLGAIRAELDAIDRGPDAGRSSLASRLAQDMSFAFRQLRRRPAFAALAVGTLAIGIAASTAIFGLVKAVVLDPLPYPEADRLVVVDQVTPNGLPFSVSVPDFSDVRERLGGLQHLSASRWTNVTFQGEEQPIRLTAAYVTTACKRAGCCSAPSDCSCCSRARACRISSWPAPARADPKSGCAWRLARAGFASCSSS